MIDAGPSPTSPVALPPPPQRLFRPYDPRGAVGRVMLAVLAGAAAAAAGPLFSRQLGWAMRLIAGWDVGAATLLGLIWFLILTADPIATRCRAASVDPGRTVVWLIVLGASACSLFAAAGLMRHAHSIAPAGGTLLVVASLAAVISAWFLTHTAFTLRYAHLYYRDDLEGEGGLNFPGDRKPDDFDFSYFAFTVGMCFQVSDVAITSPQIRRTVLAHALLSFAYNTVIVALALNLLIGILS